MGTRGSFGFRVNGKDKLTYNHYDSYPSGLGVTVLGEIRELIAKHGIDKIKESADRLVVVSGKQKPTPAVIKKLRKFADITVGSQTLDDWYVLLRKLQGKIGLTLEAGYMIDGNGFIMDSLFCEWAYVINLDDNVLEVYRGFQEKPHTKGRYAQKRWADQVAQRLRDDGKYYPCALIASYPLGSLPSDYEFSNIETSEEEAEETFTGGEQ